MSKVVTLKNNIKQQLNEIEDTVMLENISEYIDQLYDDDLIMTEDDKKALKEAREELKQGKARRLV